MKKALYLVLAAFLLCCCCNPENKEIDPKTEDPSWTKIAYAKGGDISWVTEMEKNGFKFYDSAGQEKECTALLKGIGFNAMRYRVWVNPDGGWCSKEDVLVKAKRAQALGLKIMIDFHYSDWWADPGKQPVPAAWKEYSPEAMAKAVGDHTREVLEYLKSNGIDVAWVQVGNEVTNGMLWETGRVKDQSTGSFCDYFTAGYNAVKAVYKNAAVILHIDNAWNYDTLNWYFNLMRTRDLQYDMIGLSLYPSYWQDGGYPDWKPKVNQSIQNFSKIHTAFAKPVMLCEFGMPARQPQESKEALQCLLDNTKGLEWFKGIFLWEPESEPDRNGYDQGAFSNGRPTIALSPFND